MNNSITLGQSVQYLKNVGPQRAKMLSRMGVSTIRDLLGYFPREYDDRRSPTKIAAMTPGMRAVFCGKVKAADTVQLNMNLSIFKVAVDDGTGIMFALLYRKANPYHRHDVFASLRQTFAPGNTVFLSGQCEYNFGERQLRVEEYETVAEGGAEPVHFMRIVPVYPLTEGVSQKWFREFIAKNLDTLVPLWPEILTDDMKKDLALMPAQAAVRSVHFPDDFAVAESARKRLAFDEYLLLETALFMARRAGEKKTKPFTYEVRRHLLTPFREKLRFEFTVAQKKVINEIFSDMLARTPMNRLLMGDVGSGKTVVALSAILFAVENGYQSVLLAPTEILAEQHYITICRMLDGLGVRVALLTGKTPGRKKEKEQLLATIASGGVDLVIGTHAVLEKDIAFQRLSLMVIDEQHRFGVLQRATLQTKSRNPDVLLLTATPIPRTLALTLYGDMNVSVIDRLPSGRQPINTLHLDEQVAYELAKKEVLKGRQVYIVYPLVEESDKIELKAAVQEADQLSKSVFNECRVGLLHGQMKAEEKQRVMLAFREHTLDILISTTVIEVGIDVPNATMMIIEHADRFGLATLHQLRGRVGRGSEKSYCILLGNPKSDDARKRMAVMISTTDGFKIAEEDLALRGPGEFFGTLQHGMPELKAGNLATDTLLIEQARTAATALLDGDPGLQQPEFKAFKHELFSTYGHRFGLLKIG